MRYVLLLSLIMSSFVYAAGEKGSDPHDKLPHGAADAAKGSQNNVDSSDGMLSFFEAVRVRLENSEDRDVSELVRGVASVSTEGDEVVDDEPTLPSAPNEPVLPPAPRNSPPRLSSPVRSLLGPQRGGGVQRGRQRRTDGKGHGSLIRMMKDPGSN